MHPRLFLCIVILLSIGLAGCRWVEDGLNHDIQALNINTRGIEYQIIWPEDLEPEIKSALEHQSSLAKLAHRAPISLAGLVKRCEKDMDVFQKVLASLGYFNAKVKFDVREETTPLHVILQIETGPSYKVGKIKVRCQDNPSVCTILTQAIISDIIRVQSGDSINLEKISKGAERIKKHLQNMGYPFAEVGAPEGTVHPDHCILDVDYPLKTDSLARIESTEIQELKNLHEDFIVNRVRWKKGDVFNQEKLESTRRALLETGLLAGVTISVEKKGPPTPLYQPVKMIVKTPEAATRAIGVGLKFSTSEKIGGKLFWHHNNIRGHGEHVGVSFRSSKRETKAKLAYDIPDFLQPLQLLRNEFVWLREKNRAYTGKSLNIGTRLQRPLADYFETSLGVAAEEGRITRETQVYKTRLFAFPGELKADFTDNLLDPTRGLKANAKITPYFGQVGRTKGMVIGLASLSGYLPFFINEVNESRLVLASFIKGGSIFNQNLNSIPPNKRFYAGGGGSVRGYGYQLLGPLDSQSTPEGGKSLAEMGTEIRVRMTETTGVVMFLEGGSVTKGRKPEFIKKTLWGYGAGFRYYSPLGPVRIDIAFPCKRRHDTNGKSLDSAFQLYLSIGQAF